MHEDSYTVIRSLFVSGLSAGGGELGSKEPMPTRLGRYMVRAKIGEGGMATVYLGQSEAEGDLVALKVIKEKFSLQRDFLMMFMDEAKIASRLSHPNIVRVLELGNEGTRLFLAMELLFGQSLWNAWDAVRARNESMPLGLASWIGARVADALHYAHELVDERGASMHLVHRDINGSNIFLTYEGEAKVIDFGLAKAANRVSKTAAGVVKGKLAYLSPEQAMGHELDRRSDIFALGTTIWEITANRRLFRVEDDVETLKRVHAAVVPAPTEFVPGYPDPLWQVLRRALAREAKDRYATAQDLAGEFDRVARLLGVRDGQKELSTWMKAVFDRESERDQAWAAGASKPERRAPLPTLRPKPNGESFLPSFTEPIGVHAPGIENSSPRVDKPVKRAGVGNNLDAKKPTAADEPKRGSSATLIMVVSILILVAIALLIFGRR